MSFVALVAYALVGLFHEVAALRFWDVARKVAKAALMPVLLVFYLVATSNVIVWVVLAIVFCWLGDVILIRKGDPNFFRLGMVAFLLGHVFYIVTLVGMTHGSNLPAQIVASVVALAAVIVLPRLINPPKAMRVPIIVYGAVILAMSVCALLHMLDAGTPSSVLVFVGSLVFIFSDVLMTYLSYHTRPKYFDAITMLPYIVAQGLIVYGLAVA